jgi:hypothetical protein
VPASLNEVYARIAVVLTEFENHRTQTGFEDALILKTFLFQFVNSYFTLVRLSVCISVSVSWC